MSMRVASRWQRHSLACVAIAFAIGTLGACDGGSKSGNRAAAPDSTFAQADDPAAVNDAIRASGIYASRNACELLTRADAEAAVGQPLPQNTVKNVAQGMCDYNAVDFSAGASVTVDSWDSIKGAATSGKNVPTTIAGVGNEALNLNGSNGSILYVRRGDEGFLLTLNGPNIDHLPDHGLGQEKRLALKILARF